MATQNLKPMVLDGHELREMTDAELTQRALDNAQAEAHAKAEADKAKLKADTLAKLGLTADEVAALLS
jgi:hypothetical protein